MGERYNSLFDYSYIMKRLDELFHEQEEFEEVFTELDKLEDSIDRSGGEWPMPSYRVVPWYSNNRTSSFYSDYSTRPWNSYSGGATLGYYYDLESSWTSINNVESSR